MDACCSLFATWLSRDPCSMKDVMRSVFCCAHRIGSTKNSLTKCVSLQIVDHPRTCLAALVQKHETALNTFALACPSNGRCTVAVEDTFVLHCFQRLMLGAHLSCPIYLGSFQFRPVHVRFESARHFGARPFTVNGRLGRVSRHVGCCAQRYTFQRQLAANSSHDRLCQTRLVSTCD